MGEKGSIVVEREQIAEPAPLGLSAFAFTVFCLSVYLTGWAPAAYWVGPAMFYGGIVLVLAGMWEFKKNNVFAATVFSTYGGFWLSIGFFVVLYLAGVIPAAVNLSDSLGWILAAFLCFNTYATITALLAPLTLFAAIFLTELTIIFMMIGFFRTSEGWTKASGYAGLAASAFAWYTSFALMFNITAKKSVFPCGNALLSFASPAAAEEGEP